MSKKRMKASLQSPYDNTHTHLFALKRGNEISINFSEMTINGIGTLLFDLYERCLLVTYQYQHIKFSTIQNCIHFHIDITLFRYAFELECNNPNQ